jgi:hypothetical protein
VVYHLAQINIGRARAEMTDSIMQGFMANLDKINALAERSPGFVWRLQSNEGNATSFRFYDDPLLIVNMSVWESVETLRAFTYHSEHLDFLKQRKQWFEALAKPHLAMWWIPAGHLPEISEANEKLELLERLGPSQAAFSFAKVFSPPEA